MTYNVSMTYNGFATRTHAEIMHKADNEPLRMTVSGAPGASLTLQGDANNMHWAGSINAERTRWEVGCQFGFRHGGSCVFRDGRYELVGDFCFVPPELRLPGEAA